MKLVWVLVDESNSNPRGRQYLWWFETRALAREHRSKQLKMKTGAVLSQPQQWVKPK